MNKQNRYSLYIGGRSQKEADTWCLFFFFFLLAVAQIKICFKKPGG